MFSPSEKGLKCSSRTVFIERYILFPIQRFLYSSSVRKLVHLLFFFSRICSLSTLSFSSYNLPVSVNLFVFSNRLLSLTSPCPQSYYPFWNVLHLLNVTWFFWIRSLPHLAPLISTRITTTPSSHVTLCDFNFASTKFPMAIAIV